MSDSNTNPYAYHSPAESVDAPSSDEPQYTLFSIPWIVFAAFLGTLAAAGLLLGMNFWRVERKWAAVSCALLLAGITGGVVWLGEISPERVPATVFLLPQLFIAYATATSLQGRMIANHQSQGGRLASGWAASGIALGVALVFTGAFIVSETYLYEHALGTRVEVGLFDEIYYSPEATEQDARRLGYILEDELYFGDPPGTTALITKREGVFEISFVMQDGAWDELPTVDYYRDLGQTLAEEEFGLPLVVHFCDEYVVVQKSIRLE